MHRGGTAASARLLVLLAALGAAARGQDRWADHRIPPDWPGHAYTASPQDWRHLAVYQVMTDRFANGDPRNDHAHGFSTAFDASPGEQPTEGWRRTIGGDIRGLTEHLDYVKSLGFDVVWISAPMLGTEPNGYAPATYSILDPKLGTLAEFRAFVDAAHARGMYVIVDCVANHFANWFHDQLGFDGGGYGGLSYRWPGQREYGAPFGDPLGPNDFHNHGWVVDWNDGRQLEVGELVGLDDLRTETDWVRNYVIERWSNLIRALDVDGFRVDAIKHVRVGDMAQMCEAWRRAAAAVGKRNFYLFGEAYSGSHDAVGWYTGNEAGTGKKVMNGMMDYVMYLDGVPWKLFQDPWALKRWIEGMNNGAYDMGQGDGAGRWEFGNLNLHFADNHDQPRFLSTVGDQAQMAAVTALMTMIEGVGSLYYGSEQAFNTGGRNGVGGYPAMFDHPFQADNAAGDNFDQGHWLYQRIARIMRARKRIGPGLGFGTAVQEPRNGLFCWKRGDDALIAVNGTGGRQRATVWFGDGRFVDLVGGATVQGPWAEVDLDRWGVAVFVKNADPADLEPLVESVSPRHGERSGAAQVAVTFDRDLDPGAAAAASLFPDAGGRWRVSGRRLVYDGGTFQAGWMYTVRVAGSARGANGRPLAGGVISRFWSTGSGPGLISPEVGGNQVTFRHRGGARAALKGSWRVTGKGGPGEAFAVADPAWDGGAELPMVDRNGVWTATVTLEPGRSYEYGLVIDGRWTNDPANPDHAANGNDQVRTGDSPEVRGDRVVLRVAGGRAATVRGSWQAGRWDPLWDGGRETPMALANGVWTVTLPLERGKSYEYGFLVDGQWNGDAQNQARGGTGNARFTLPAGPASPEVAGDRVTLRVVGGRSATVKGSWRVTGGGGGAWSAVHDAWWDGGRELPMTLVNGVWTITLTLERGKSYEYGFLVDGRWTDDPLNGDRAGNGNDRFDLP